MNHELKPAAHAWADRLAESHVLRDLYQPLWKMPETRARALLRRTSWVAATVGHQYLAATAKVVPQVDGDAFLQGENGVYSVWDILNAMMLTPQETLSDPVRAALRACPAEGIRPGEWDAQVIRLKMRLAFAEPAGVLLAGLRGQSETA